MTRRKPARAVQRPTVPEPVPLVDEFEDDLDDDGLDDFYEDDEGPEPLDTTDADAFFAAEVLSSRPAGLTLYKREYVLPTRTPLSFSLLAERHATDETLDSFRTVLTPVFGADALDHWIEQGMDARQLAIILMWAAQNMDKPGSASLADCARRYAEQEARGKALPNRAVRRAASGGRSSRTGRS
ncbi:hypothetical protein [Kitasatospora sp. McL0602]|uniref:hypothetical protein n=1 Tax=Kitasatospora sp. McL0602 TaxID=3439530 RepID=UPI003F8B8919